MASFVDLVGVSRSFESNAGTIIALPVTHISISDGEFVAIEGPSGSGKSTLLNIIGLLDLPTSGTYHFDGTDAAELSSRQRAHLRARSVGFVFQAFHLLTTKNVIDNVAAGLLYGGQGRRQRYELAYAALCDLGLEHRASAHPSTLSGGERQRVAIARAIIGDKRLLLADEPTGNLDRDATDNLLATLTQLHDKGMTIVVVTHDDEVASAADRRMVVGTRGAAAS